MIHWGAIPKTSSACASGRTSSETVLQARQNAWRCSIGWLPVQAAATGCAQAWKPATPAGQPSPGPGCTSLYVASPHPHAAERTAEGGGRVVALALCSPRRLQAHAAVVVEVLQASPRGDRSCVSSSYTVGDILQLAGRKAAGVVQALCRRSWRAGRGGMRSSCAGMERAHWHRTHRERDVLLMWAGSLSAPGRLSTSPAVQSPTQQLPAQHAPCSWHS